MAFGIDDALLFGGLGLAGSLFGGGDQQTTQSTQLPSWLERYGPGYAEAGWNLANTPYEPYQYGRVADFNPYQFAGFNAGSNWAMNNQITDPANSLTGSTLRGDFLDPSSNPYFSGTVNRALDDATSRLNDMFRNSYGSSAHQETAAKALGGIAGDLYSQNYNNERGRQLQTLGLAPQTLGLGYTNANALTGIGGAIQGQGQNYLNDLYQRFQEQQNYPYRQFGVLSSMFGNPGSTTTTTSPGVSPLAGALGGISGGLGLLGQWGRLFPNNSGQPQQPPQYPWAGIGY